MLWQTGHLDDFGSFLDPLYSVGACCLVGWCLHTHNKSPQHNRAPWTKRVFVLKGRYHRQVWTMAWICSKGFIKHVHACDMTLIRIHYTLNVKELYFHDLRWASEHFFFFAFFFFFSSSILCGRIAQKCHIFAFQN